MRFRLEVGGRNEEPDGAVRVLRPQPGAPLAHILTADGLVKRFGDLTAVDGVSIQISEGETFGLLGPNGAGKTTSISMIAGLLEPDSGRVEVDGIAITTRTTKGKVNIGLVPQDLAIYPDLTAVENLKFFGHLYGKDGSGLEKRIDEVLVVIGLSDRRNDLVKEYSGGMKRRLNIGIGLLHRPRLLILDEPTVGVDPQSRNAILESVENLSAEGMAVLYTTHYMEEAERLCDRVAIIDEGRVKAEGTRRELVAMVGEKDRIVIGATGDLTAGAAAAGGVPGVVSASGTETRIDVLADDASVILPELLGRVGAAGASISGVEVVEPNLEAVFLHLTGKALRD
jgi:ABC-2 type transport system ATP-binding protein